MNVKKININQSEPSYYIASDIYDVTANNNGVTFPSLTALLSADNLSTLIPSGIRCGGMSIRFIQSSDNKYVQYFLDKDEWSVSETDWQKLNLEEELVKLSQEIGDSEKKLEAHYSALFGDNSLTQITGTSESRNTYAVSLDVGTYYVEFYNASKVDDGVLFLSANENSIIPGGYLMKTKAGEKSYGLIFLSSDASYVKFAGTGYVKLSKSNGICSSLFKDYLNNITGNFEFRQAAYSGGILFSSTTRVCIFLQFAIGKIVLNEGYFINSIYELYPSGGYKSKKDIILFRTSYAWNVDNGVVVVIQKGKKGTNPITIDENIINNIEIGSVYTKATKEITLKNFDNNFIIGEGADENLHHVKVDGIKDVSLRINGRYVLQANIDNLKPFSFDFGNYNDAIWVQEGASALPTTTTSMTPVSLSDYKNIQLSCHSGLCCVVIKYDVLSRLSQHVSGSTVEEKINNIKQLANGLMFTYTAYSNDRESKITSRQASSTSAENNLIWDGTSSNYIDSDVPADLTRGISFSSITSDGFMWMLLVSPLPEESTLVQSSLNLSYVSASINLNIKRKLTSAAHYVDRDDINVINNTSGKTLTFDRIRTLGSVGNIRDYYEIYGNTCYLVHNIKTYKLTSPNIAFVELLTYNTLATPVYYSVLSLSKTDLPDYKNGSTNIEMIFKDTLHNYANSKLKESIYFDDDYFYLVINGDYSSKTPEELKDLMKGAIFVYEKATPEKVPWVSGNENESFTLNEGDSITISSRGYQPLITETKLIYNGNKTITEGVVQCDNFSICGVNSSYVDKDTPLITDDVSKAMHIVNVVPSDVRQSLYGVGAAITEAAAYNMLQMPADNRTAFIKDVFGKDNSNFSFIRVCIGSSDFRVDTDRYTYDDSETLDVNIPNFSIGNDGETPTKDYRYVIPILKEIIAVNSDIKVIGCPWVYPEVARSWVDVDTPTYVTNYLIKFIEAYESEGIKIYGISPMNEPELMYKGHTEWGINNGKFDLELAITRFNLLITDYLGPKLKTIYPHIKLYGFESNFNDAGLQWFDLLNAATNEYYDGMSFHTYYDTYGKSETMLKFHALKDKDLGVTERRCMMVDKVQNTFLYMFVQIAGNWMQASNFITLWNFSLNENGTPSVNHGRRGVVTIKSDGSAIYKNPEYYMLEMFSKYVKSGARFVGSTRDEKNGVYSISILNPDNTLKVSIINYNPYSRYIGVHLYDKTYISLVNGYGTTSILYQL